MLLVDDHPVFAEALATRLASEPDLDVLPVAHTVAQAITELARSQPTVVVLDVRLREESGLAVLDHVGDQHRDTKVIILTAVESVDIVVDAVRRGARAWVPKYVDVAQLIRVIHEVVRGGAWIPSGVLGAVLTRLLEPGSAESDPLATLTAREREVLQCMVDGLSRAEIAKRLYLSMNTVRTHANNLLTKLGSHSVLEAVAIAQRAGMRQSGEH